MFSFIQNPKKFQKYLVKCRKQYFKLCFESDPEKCRPDPDPKQSFKGGM